MDPPILPVFECLKNQDPGPAPTKGVPEVEEVSDPDEMRVPTIPNFDNATLTPIYKESKLVKHPMSPSRVALLGKPDLLLKNPPILGFQGSVICITVNYTITTLLRN